MNINLSHLNGKPQSEMPFLLLHMAEVLLEGYYHKFNKLLLIMIGRKLHRAFVRILDFMEISYKVKNGRFSYKTRQNIHQITNREMKRLEQE